MKKLTRAQLNVLDAITKNVNKRNYAPSVQEICDTSGLKSKSTVHRHLKNLKDSGYIHWEEGQPRTLKVMKDVSELDRKRLSLQFEYAY
ncbi:helix-turn-helix domain-containing protein [Fictibacillus sp. 23RED33]|uniref:LexA family protein n=1 Tax=Fictibacillus sp. 23RED33 TaxID=2745879 RepID=UPI0018CD11F5|nr:MarR family transcriptional regulator [Fictibacillus sp. 23RED33]MBH0174698.1 helix-turn-helix domain-containing protein [Fictibacillus sp. 23RED33]